MARVKMLVIAFVAALPIEAFNFMIAGAMFDPGPADPRWRWKLITFEWLILHMPAVASLERIEHVSGCRQLNTPGSCGRVDAFALFGIGYLDTVLVLLLLIFGFQWLLRLTRSRTLS